MWVINMIMSCVYYNKETYLFIGRANISRSFIVYLLPFNWIQLKNLMFVSFLMSRTEF
jgi:hypothetical protein